jgi:hypothetical protein
MGRVGHSWRAAGLWFALIALALRLAAPAGFMLAPDDHNRLTVTLCSGLETHTAEIDLATGKIAAKKAPGQNDKGKADAPCSFAAAAVAAVDPQSAPLAAPLLQSVAFALTPLATRPSLQAAGPPLPARGPPHYA